MLPHSTSAARLHLKKTAVSLAKTQTQSFVFSLIILDLKLSRLLLRKPTEEESLPHCKKLMGILIKPTQKQISKQTNQ